MPRLTSNKPFECTICKKKWYKSSAGLSRYENAKHNDYKTPPIQQYILPENAINKWKKMLGQYLGLFKKHLTWVFINRKVYRCVFSGPNTYQTISSILDNQYWGVRYYKCNQVSYVVLLIQTTAKNLVPALDAILAKKAAKKKKKQGNIDK
ncbi:26564_t:CDS:2, partial [Dentiscutata erythropus]